MTRLEPFAPVALPTIFIAGGRMTELQDDASSSAPRQQRLTALQGFLAAPSTQAPAALMNAASSAALESR
jgi:hypothetical protein